MDGPMIRPVDAPENWFCNTRKEHSEGGLEISWYDRRAKLHFTTIECNCLRCLGEKMNIVAGSPLQVHKDYDLQELTRRGLVGVFRTGEEG